MTPTHPIIIPPSLYTVTLSILNTTALTNLPTSQCMSPIYPGMKTYNAPSYSFLIEHEPTGFKMVFDLGVPKNWKTMMSADDVKELTETMGIGIHVDKDVAEVLQENHCELNSIKHIIYSHHHYDHVGDPSTFPTTTSIIVGPGFQKAYLPGYPTNPSSELLYDAEKNKGREIIELDFNPSTSKYKCLTIGGFQAIDFFQDGSLFLLATPGHTMSHISALARTTSTSEQEAGVPVSTFVLLGGDIAHHASVFRPSRYLPLPEIISPSPLSEVGDADPGPSSCHREDFLKHHYRYHESGGKTLAGCTPFGKVAGPDDDLPLSQRSVEQLMLFDAMENVFVIFAHDESLADVVDYYPKTANGWKSRGWKEKGLWRFLPQLLLEANGDGATSTT
jgi:glyoxylase-like metal-dependent hydrolase (beta-lactamase superfamily II)